MLRLLFIDVLQDAIKHLEILLKSPLSSKYLIFNTGLASSVIDFFGCCFQTLLISLINNRFHNVSSIHHTNSSFLGSGQPFAFPPIIGIENHVTRPFLDFSDFSLSSCSKSSKALLPMSSVYPSLTRPSLNQSKA